MPRNPGERKRREQLPGARRAGLRVYPQQQYGQQGYPQQYGQPGYGEQTNPKNTLSIIGIVCGVVSLLFLPIILGPAGIVLGVVAKSKKERLAVPAIIVSVVGMIGGFIIGYLVFRANS